jgi:hypothetical protein
MVYLLFILVHFLSSIFLDSVGKVLGQDVNTKLKKPPVSEHIKAKRKQKVPENSPPHIPSHEFSC